MINMPVYSILSRWPKMYNNPATYVIFRGRQWMWLQHMPPLVWYSFNVTKELSYGRSRVEVFEPSSGETKSDCCKGLLFDIANHCMSQQMVILFLTCHSNNGGLGLNLNLSCGWWDNNFWISTTILSLTF
jgi:hypothetical protein